MKCPSTNASCTVHRMRTAALPSQSHCIPHSLASKPGPVVGHGIQREQQRCPRMALCRVPLYAPWAPFVPLSVLSVAHACCSASLAWLLNISDKGIHYSFSKDARPQMQHRTRTVTPLTCTDAHPLCGQNQRTVACCWCMHQPQRSPTATTTRT